MDENSSQRGSRARRPPVAFDAGRNPPIAKKAGKRKAPISETQPDNGTPIKAGSRSSQVSKRAPARMPLEPTSANDRAPVAASAPPAPIEAPIKAPIEAPIKAPIEAPIKAPIEAPIEITEDDELSDVFDDASYDFGDAEGANETAAVEEIAPVVEERSQRAQADPSRRESVQEMEASQRGRAIRRSGNDVSESLFVGQDEASDDEPLEHRVQVGVRWRAGLGNLEKGIINTAYNSDSLLVIQLESDDLWQWVNRTLAEQRRKVPVEVSSVTATVYHKKMSKADRWVISLRRDEPTDFHKVRRALRRILSRYSWPPNLDFDLLLVAAESLLMGPTPGAAAAGPSQRPRIATNIQEQGLANTIEAGIVGDGHAMEIRDKWQCKRRADRRPDRWENHFPVSGNIIAIWCKEIDAGHGSVKLPLDYVRSTLYRAKDQAQKDRERKRQKEAPGDAAVVGQNLQQMQAAIMSKQIMRLLRRGLIWIRQSPDDFTTMQRTSLPTKQAIYHRIFRQERWTINQVIDNSDYGMSMDIWTYNYKAPIALLSAMRRKVAI
ncbi:hypothetical protein BDV95DRAFT_594117 [Massariosphaeria phaeospora]|uniref:Uncharacterized protein n=1 Tax=Massariosphaeria phaeospora TaxID=100035 RepID=A0A7C8M8P2_9PLEO|nr:hypothetical protein BDV95DRAFT_594117 [Massariosphaeria phaeospora]